MSEREKERMMNHNKWWKEEEAQSISHFARDPEQELVERLVENSATFKGKTVFSQEKYIRKKLKK